MRPAASESLDFAAYHQRDLPALLGAGGAVLAADATRGLRSLALRIRDGEAYTYRPTASGVELIPGDADADTVIELDLESWRGLVRELEAAAGLLYANRVRCLRGKALDLMAWEPGLRALYNGHPIYDPARLDLRDEGGLPLDVERSFCLADQRDEMAHFLRVAGYLCVREVFAPEEIAAFRSEADELRDEAQKGDRLSWWGRNAAGEEVLCRVTRAAVKPALGSLRSEPRLEALVALADEPLQHRRGEGDVTVIYKNPGMTEGLGDIPWHRDCGMGGHSAMCPILIASIYLTEATPESGDLRFLPGSRFASYNAHVERQRGLRPALFRAAPGDVTLHYSDTVHAAPPPVAPDLEQYRWSAIVGFAPPGAHHHRGERSYNDVLHQREDGQIEHLEQVAARR